MNRRIEIVIFEVTETGELVKTVITVEDTDDAAARAVFTEAEYQALKCLKNNLPTP